MIDHRPYFRSLKTDCLTDHLLGRLYAVADSIAQGHVPLETWEGTSHDHIHLYRITDDEIPEIAVLRELNCVVRPLAMVCFPPNIIMPIHRDPLEYRKCTLSIPLTPREPNSYAATHWYAAEDDREPVVSTAHAAGAPKLFNVDQYHNLKTGPVWRVNLQVALDSSYADVVEMIANGTFSDHHLWELED